jgi:hypothetical protein
MSVRDALVGEILGELVQVRQAVEQFQTQLPGSIEQIKAAGELAGHRFAEQVRHVAAQLDERTVTLNAAAQEFRAVRELLMGELAVKTSQQFESTLQDVAKRMTRTRRRDLFSASLIGAFVALVIAVPLIAAVKHLI